MQRHDDKRSSEEPSSDANDVPQSATASGPDLRRRKLVHGAAVAVPTIITLRSGAAAAAVSIVCPQIKGEVDIENDSGKLNLATYRNPGTTPIVGGDVCAPNANACPTYPNLTLVTVNENGQNLKCSGFTEGQTVYIISESSAVSLL